MVASSCRDSDYRRPGCAPRRRRALVARQDQLDSGPAGATPRVGGVNFAVVRVGDRAHDGQAEAGAALRPAAGRIGAVEALEHPLALGGGDAGSVVDDREKQPPGAGFLDLEPDQTGGFPDRVGGQVAQGLGEPIGIGEQRAVRERRRARSCGLP